MLRRSFQFLFIGAIAFIIPFIYSTETGDPNTLPRFLVLAVLALILTIYILFSNIFSTELLDRYKILLSNPILVLYFALVIISTISLFFSKNTSAGIFETLKLFLMFHFLIISVFIISQDENILLTLSRALTIGSIVIGLVGIAQYHDLGFTTLPGKYVPYSFMNHKNLFASYLFLTLPFILIALLKPLQKERVNIIEDKTSALHGLVKLTIWQFICIIAVLTVVYSIVVSNTRAVWLAIIISICAVLISLLTSWQDILSGYINARRIRKLFLLTVSLAILLIVILTVTLDIDIRTTDNSRFKLWSNTLVMIADNLWIGVGPGNWKIQFPGYGLEGTPFWVEFGIRHFLRPHNDYLLTAAETGIFGFIAYLGVISLTLYYLVGSIIRSNDASDRLTGILFLFGLTGYIVIAFFSYPKERIAHSILFTLMVAWIITKRLPSPQSSRLLPVASLTVYTIFSVIILSCSIYVGISIYNSGIHAKAALIAKAYEDWEGVIEEIDKADSPFYRLELTSTPLAWYRGVANFALENNKAALSDFEAARLQHPYHIHVLNNLASSYELMGNRANAIKYYNEALRISPYFDESLMNLSMVYYNLGQYDTAMELLLKCKQKCDKPLLYELIDIVKEKQQKEEGDKSTPAYHK